jgi:hypothetical protein
MSRVLVTVFRHQRGGRKELGQGLLLDVHLTGHDRLLSASSCRSRATVFDPRQTTGEGPFIADWHLGMTDQVRFMSTGFMLRLIQHTLFESHMKHLGIVLKIPRITSVDTPLIVPMLAFAGFGSGRK